MSDKRRRGYIWRHQGSGKSIRTIAADMGISSGRLRELYDEEIARRLHGGKDPL